MVDGDRAGEASRANLEYRHPTHGNLVAARAIDWRVCAFGHLAQTLIARGRDFEITIANQSETDEPHDASSPRRLMFTRPPYRGWIEAIGVVVIAAVVAAILDRYLPAAELSVVFLFAVLIAAIRHGLGPDCGRASLPSPSMLFTEPR